MKHDADPAVAESDMKKTVLRLLTAIATKDRPMASPCLAQHVTWWVPQSANAASGIPRPMRGREAVLDLLCGPSLYAPGSMLWSPHQVLLDQSFVVVHCSLTAQTANGHPYENQYALLYRFEGRLIAESWEHTDTAYAFATFRLGEQA